MIQDKTIDETLIELMRCQRALAKLRAARQEEKRVGGAYYISGVSKTRAAAKRASLDLTRKLADLRAGR